MKGDSVLFHIFNSQQERREYAGSAFIELQLCALPEGTPIEEIVDNVTHWKDNSLYIDDENEFYREYGRIFDCGIYNNLSRGTVDVYGINYYSSDMTDSIIIKINQEKPAEYEILLSWLEKTKEYNGFYILGL